MVILFSSRKSKLEKEIIDILTRYGGNYISDKRVRDLNGAFTVVSEYKKTDIEIKRGIAVILDDTSRFEGQTFPTGLTGICESGNKCGLEILRKSKIPVITCGNNSKNTLTLSSKSENNILLSLQRTVLLLDKTEAEPCEISISLTKAYEPFSVMAAAAILILNGIIPDKF